ncbi:Unknown protein, partial [Striga hermonthica]
DEPETSTSDPHRSLDPPFLDDDDLLAEDLEQPDASTSGTSIHLADDSTRGVVPLSVLPSGQDRSLEMRTAPANAPPKGEELAHPSSAELGSSAEHIATLQPHSLGEHPTRVFKYTSGFNPKTETPFVPVWCRLPSLSPHLYHRDSITTLAKCVGKLVCIDGPTALQSRANVARFCVVIDLRVETVHEIKIEQGSETFSQRVNYKKIPAFCSSCCHVGHIAADSYISGNKPRPTLPQRHRVSQLGPSNRRRDPKGKGKGPIHAPGSPKGAKDKGKAVMVVTAQTGKDAHPNQPKQLASIVPKAKTSGFIPRDTLQSAFKANHSFFVFLSTEAEDETEPSTSDPH